MKNLIGKILAFFVAVGIIGMIVSAIFSPNGTIYNFEYPTVYFMILVWVFGFALIAYSIWNMGRTNRSLEKFNNEWYGRK